MKKTELKFSNISKFDNIKLALTFDDVLLVPQESEVIPSEVNLKTKVTKNIEMNIPFLSAAMDTVTESDTAIALAIQGGIGIIHKNMTALQQAKEVRRVKRHSSWIITDPVTLDPEDTIEQVKEIIKEKGYSSFPVVDMDSMLIGILTNRDIRYVTDDKTLVKQAMRYDPITAAEDVTEEDALKILNENKIEKLPVVSKQGKLKGLITLKDIIRIKTYPNACKDARGRLRVGAAVGPFDLERVEALANEGVDIIVVDTAHGHSKNVINAVRTIKSKYSVDVIAGNVATPEGVKALIDAGADAVKIGVGPGSICTTRIVAGTGVPQITAIEDAYLVAREHGVPIVGDGGVRYSGDIAKAIGAGASCVMMGSLFAGTEESPGEVVFVGGRKYKQYRGMGSIGAMVKGSKDRYGQKDVSNKKLVAEGVEGIVPYKGRLEEVVFQMLGGLKSAMGYSGCKSIPEFIENAKFIRITDAGLKESHPHEIAITKEAPNYSVTKE